MRNAFVIFILAALAWPLTAADLTVEERLTRLEQEVATLKAENEALRKRLGATAPAAVAAPAKAPVSQSAIKIGGLLQAQAESGDRPDSRFSDANDRVFLRRARLNAEGRLPFNTSARIELDLAGSLSPSSGMRAQVTDGYVTWARWPLASIRAGQFKTPFGHEQLFADPRLIAPERGLTSDRLTPGRQLGAQIFGDIADGGLTYALGAFNGNGTNTNSNDNERFLTAGRVAGTLFRSNALQWRGGVNGFMSRDRAVAYASDFGLDSTPATAPRDSLFAGSRRGTGVDTQLVAGRAEIWSEYLSTTFEPEDAIPSRRFVASGWSILGAWMLVPGRLQAVSRLEHFDPNDRVPGDATRLWSAGMTWLLKENDLKLQLFYMRGRTAGRDEGRVVARVQTVF